jgi:hypothetical protein
MDIKEMSFDELILEGERVRETGNPKAAIAFFDRATIFGEPWQKSTAYCQRALCYEHLGQLDTAATDYVVALNFAEFVKDTADIARAERHLSSVALKKGEFNKAINLAISAYSRISSLVKPPTDMIWVAHGVVKALIEAKRPRKEIYKWVTRELKSLLDMWPREKNQIRKWVWTTGWMMDAAYVYAPFGWVLLPIAYLITRVSNLKLRQRQMETGKR